MTTKFKPEEWWPVLALHACGYTMSVYDATPEDAETILDSRIEPVIWQIGRDFYLAAGGKKEK